ncbi:transposase [Moorena producens PAL-8-15-08-1]|uniref:Transposase n=1 Tax=Moorena producens PAL-8-15-08-1 TaxID=1458985 RepID=A0A1D8TPH9_9CYAN|nr:IS4 family transposase [Moorena producens]AOW99557.1 transposase [Moorena producens PAL-8-15-08-1]
MLPLLYQKHLRSQLKYRHFILFNILVILIQSIKKVSLEKLANALPLGIKLESRRKRIQRFLSLQDLKLEAIWFPIIASIMETYLETDQLVYVVIDRTNWGKINLLVTSLIWDKRAFPIYFTLLPKLGSSNIKEQTCHISKIMPIFKDYKICLLGDREFCSVRLAKWLSQQSLSFCLRLKKNEFIEVKKQIWIELDSLGLVPGTSLFFEGVKVTKTKESISFNIAGKWKRKISGFAPKEPWFILTNLKSLDLAIAAYKKRFNIEQMFRYLKKGGYNLEDTNVSGDRLIFLILLIAVAYTSSTLQGQEIKRKGVQKYVGIVKEYGRLQRRHSSFYIGLYAQTWVNLSNELTNLIQDLMRVNPNKQKYYLRGMRAMKLALSAL